MYRTVLVDLALDLGPSINEAAQPPQRGHNWASAPHAAHGGGAGPACGGGGARGEFARFASGELVNARLRVSPATARSARDSVDPVRVRACLHFLDFRSCHRETRNAPFQDALKGVAQGVRVCARARACGCVCVCVAWGGLEGGVTPTPRLLGYVGGGSVFTALLALRATRKGPTVPEQREPPVLELQIGRRGRGSPLHRLACWGRVVNAQRMAAARPRRAVSGGALIKAECMSLLPDVLKAIERVDSDQGDSVQMVRSGPRHLFQPSALCLSLRAPCCCR